MLLMGHDRPYLAARLEDLGYRKVRDLYAYLCNHGDKLSPRITDMLARRLSGRLRLRPLDMRAYAADIRGSEEHTSELQSLMRISYAVFCLTKKHPTHPPQNSTHHLPLQYPTS